MSKKDVKSPVPMKSLSQGSEVNQADDSKHKATNVGGGGGDSKPSKALFSPLLVRVDGGDGGSDAPADDEEKDDVEEDDDAADDNEDVFNPYYFIAGLPPHASVTRDLVCLPPQIEVFGNLPLASKPTLVLDLDETLVHCTVEPIEKPDLVFPVSFNGTMYDVYVRKRPYLDYFLETVSRSFEVVVFTASQKVYADVLLDLLDPERKYIKHRLFREACLLVQGNYLKDLSVLGRDLSRTVLVDNSPHAYGYQIDNGIPIESWFDDDADTELLKLLGFLRQVFATDDVRPIVRDHFKTFRLILDASRGISVCLSAPPF